MDEIISGIWISALEQACNEELLRQHNIAAVVSIGCSPARFDGIQYSLFPEYLDMPETNLLGILNTSSEFIGTQKALGNRVLVHCVYGQSRSATVIAAYLIISGLYSLEAALDRLKQQHGSICINPGFLSQLHLLSKVEEHGAEFELLGGVITEKCDLSEIVEMNRGIKCLYCNFVYGSVSDIVVKRENKDYLDRRTDPFWEDYRSANRHKGISVAKIGLNFFATRNMAAFSTQIVAAATELVGTKKHTNRNNKRPRYSKKCTDRIQLHCPGCHRECGYYIKNGLLLCNDFLLGDLTAISIHSVQELLHKSYVAGLVEDTIPNENAIY